jgi:hypothetical protein
MRKPFNLRAQALKNGWRSGLEEALGEQLRSLRVPFEFEAFSIPFQQPAKPRRYTPDFNLFNGIIIESKGRFETPDRQKHLLVKEQYPELDIRFVFSNPNTRISKKSATTYAAWCDAKGFKYAKGFIPDAWLREPQNVASLEVIKKLRSK